MAKHVLFILPYPLHRAPSQRFRVETYFPLLAQQNIHYDTDVFFDNEAWKILYEDGSALQKAGAVLKGFARRLKTILFKSKKYDYIFIHREAAPLGPPVFEWLLARVFRKKIIYDFDDAIWIPNISKSNYVARYVKCFWKVKQISKWAYKVSAGNQYLAAWAAKQNTSVVINPTCVDTENRYNQQKHQETDLVSIGWTGSHSTMKYLDLLYDVLKELENEIPFTFRVICDRKPAFSLQHLEFVKWREATEIEDLLSINIGVMPLEQDEWSEGKCGFKLIQYMALGIPSVASPVGVNREIIEPGKNGFLCQTREEWKEALRRLLTDEDMRTKFGEKGREKIVEHFSTQSNASNFLSLLT